MKKAKRTAKVWGGLVALLLAAGLVLYHDPRAARGQTGTRCCGPDQVGPREIDFPYYSLRDGFSSTLLLVSDSPKPTDLTIAVRSLMGQTLLTSTTIQPQERLSIDLSPLITQLSGDVTGAFAEGSVSVYSPGPSSRWLGRSR